MRGSLAAYRAIHSAAAAQFDAKIAALEVALAEEVSEGVTSVTRVSAFTGLAGSALAAISGRLDLSNLPVTVSGWLDWLVDFLRDDRALREILFDGDDSIIKAVARGKKTGGELTVAEFELFRAGLHAWISGRPFEDIERALGVPDAKIRTCARARDLVLKIVNRKLYMISVGIAELAKAKITEAGRQDPNPAVLEILAYALRTGLDTPEKIAFARQRPGIRTRVGLHRASAEKVKILAPQSGASFRDVLLRVQLAMAFDAD